MVKGTESQNKEFSQSTTLEILFADSAFTVNTTMMVNFMCQFDRAMGC